MAMGARRRTSVELEIAPARTRLWLIVLVALCIRAYWLTMHGGAEIDNDGANYVRAAESLLRGMGYVGIWHRPELLHPPLYSMLVAGATLVTRDSVLAARLVSLAAGTLLVVPVYLVTRRVYGHRVAFIAGSLIAFEPLLVALSVRELSVALFLTFFMFGVYWAMRALDFKRHQDGIFVGAFFGFAYLTRPEALLYLFVVLAFLWSAAFVRKIPLRALVATSLAMVIPCAILAAPYVGYLHTQTGRFMWEGKSGLNYAIGARLLNGMSFAQAAIGVNEQLVEEGPLANAAGFVKQQPKAHSAGEVARYARAAIRVQASNLYHLLLTPAYGSVALLGLAFLGLFRSSWSTDRTLHEAFFGVLVLAICFSMLSVLWMWDYYPSALLPFIVIWAAKGVTEMDEFLRSTVASFNRRLPSLEHVWLGVCGVLAAAIVAAGVIDLRQTSRHLSAAEELGAWLRGHQARVGTVMSSGTAVAFYAHDWWWPLPYATSSVALRYIHVKRPAFVVLSSADAEGAPYVTSWLREGIPDRSLVRVYEATDSKGNTVAIYEVTEAA